MQSNYKVLVLEENPHNVIHIYTMLHATGLFDVHIANNAACTMNLLEKQHFHLAIMDICMSGMDGLRFIREINKRQMNTMLVLVSSHPRWLINNVCLTAKQHGLAVIGTFQKPFNHEALQHLMLQVRPGIGEATTRKYEPTPLKYIFDCRMIENSIKMGTIKAWFQPKIEISTEKIIGAEALARWDNPEHGFMLAGSFLDAIRHYKLQRMLLFRMLNDALDAHTLWQQSGHTVPVSINLPVPLFDNYHLPDELFNLVAARQINPENICFELLEDDIISQPINYYMGASRLRLKGFSLAQNDFGSGYSSMYRLISTPFTELKIDKSFVNGIADDYIRKTALFASVQLGRHLGLTVTAEGVETTRDLQYLRSIGCDCAQGFLISEAISAEDFRILLSS